MITVITHSAGETRDFARNMSKMLQPGDIISLSGDLGAGKTVFTKGLAEGLGIKEPVTSPTFTIIKEYTEGRLPLYHFDVYRLGHPDELAELGVDEYFFSTGVSVVEWGNRVASLLPEEHLVIKIERMVDEDLRRIEIEPFGSKWTERVKLLDRSNNAGIGD
jgi:tRNA threonylcarbamoyladenosine biosynthesis protein TsaE